MCNKYENTPHPIIFHFIQKRAVGTASITSTSCPLTFQLKFTSCRAATKKTPAATRRSRMPQWRSRVLQLRPGAAKINKEKKFTSFCGGEGSVPPSSVSKPATWARRGVACHFSCGRALAASPTPACLPGLAGRGRGGRWSTRTAAVCFLLVHFSAPTLWLCLNHFTDAVLEEVPRGPSLGTLPPSFTGLR